jgi:hypothetical protein
MSAQKKNGKLIYTKTLCLAHSKLILKTTLARQTKLFMFNLELITSNCFSTGASTSWPRVAIKLMELEPGSTHQKKWAKSLLLPLVLHCHIGHRNVP